MISRNTPVRIRTSPKRVWPFGLHASLLKISEGPIASLSEIALAAEASTAAFWLAGPIPPEPMRISRPERTRRMPSMNAASAGRMTCCGGKN